MGIQERKEREKQLRRNQILEAAEDLFFNKGIDITTMDDIAEKAELSKGTLYLYFKSKEDIQFELSIKGADLLAREMEKDVDADKNGLENLITTGRTFINFSKNHRGFFQLFLVFQSLDLRQLNIGEDKIERHFREHSLFTMIIELVRKGMNDGSLREDLNVINTATTLWSQLLGLMIVQEYKTEIYKFFNVDKQQIFETNFDILIHGIATN